ncbi:MAG TPA: chemotaxis protein CheW [Gemmatimonadales bacterium]|nr:chemotaxis protein CheW [Gemmatimonadales bacterium]
MTNDSEASVAQYLSFQVAGESYAVGVLQAREIIEYSTVTRVPHAPPAVRGVINLRGSVVPVVDLAVKFGLPASEIGRRTCVVIVECRIEGEAMVMGVMADAVNHVLDLGPADIEPAPSFGTRVRSEYLKGMGKLEQGFVLLLDMDKLLSGQDAAAGQPVPVEA